MLTDSPSTTTPIGRRWRVIPRQHPRRFRSWTSQGHPVGDRARFVGKHTHVGFPLLHLHPDLRPSAQRDDQDLSGGELHHRCHPQAQVGCCHHDSQGGKCGSNEPVQVRQTDDLRGFVGGILSATFREAGYLRLPNHHQVTEPTLFQRYIRV